MLTISGFERAFAYWQLFLQGVVGTVALSALTVLFGFVLAMLLTLCRLGRAKLLRAVATAYVEFIRATPMVVQIAIVFYVIFSDVKFFPGIKLFGFLRLDRFIPAMIAMALNSGAYVSEIIRSGIQSIDPGQSEAARSLGLNAAQTLRFVILPQAIRNILPAIGNEFVTIIKESAICFTIGVQDIMSAVNAVKGATYRINEALVIACVLYFCLTYPASQLIAHFERRMNHGR